MISFHFYFLHPLLLEDAGGLLKISQGDLEGVHLDAEAFSEVFNAVSATRTSTLAAVPAWYSWTSS